MEQLFPMCSERWAIERVVVGVVEGLVEALHETGVSEVID